MKIRIPQYNPPSVDLDSLTWLLESFLADARAAVVLEDGEELFTLSSDGVTDRDTGKIFPL